MAPYGSSPTITSTLEIENDVQNVCNGKDITFTEKPRGPEKSDFQEFLSKLKWFNITIIFVVHAVFVWGVFAFPYKKCWDLILFHYILGLVSGAGVTAGVHRLWTHRSYKATVPLRVTLMLCYCLAGHNPIFNWVRDHRVHHKFTDTDADPHNSKRGFFFSHVGWLMMKKHPEVTRRGKEVDMSDVLADPVIQFHQKYYVPLVLIIGFIVPTLIPPLCWGQSWLWSFLSTFVGRYCILLNTTWLVNSGAHMWGTRPYDKKISSSETLGVSLFTMGEGWHNYHHTFPWSYRTGEFGMYAVNGSTFVIDMFAKLGWAYDLKTPSAEMIKRAVQRAGDGTHPLYGDMEIPESEENIVNKKEVNTDKND